MSDSQGAEMGSPDQHAYHHQEQQHQMQQQMQQHEQQMQQHHQQQMQQQAPGGGHHHVYGEGVSAPVYDHGGIVQHQQQQAGAHPTQHHQDHGGHPNGQYYPGHHQGNYQQYHQDQQNAAQVSYDFAAYQHPPPPQDAHAAQAAPYAIGGAAQNPAAMTGVSYAMGPIPPAVPVVPVITHAPITTPIPVIHPDEGKKRKRFTNEEKEAVKKGVEQYGPGDWKTVRAHYIGILHGRTAVNIKDCFRTMVRRGDLPENWGQEAKKRRKQARKEGKLFGFYNTPLSMTPVGAGAGAAVTVAAATSLPVGATTAVLQHNHNRISSAVAGTMGETPTDVSLPGPNPAATHQHYTPVPTAQPPSITQVPYNAAAEDHTHTRRRPKSLIKRRKFSKEEKTVLIEGIEKLGVGNWKMILEEYADTFGGRTGQQLKDLYRTMVRLGQIPKVEESDESKVKRKKKCAEYAREARAKKKAKMEKDFSANAKSAEAAVKAAEQQHQEHVTQPEGVDPNYGTAYAQPQPMWNLIPAHAAPIHPVGYSQPQHQEYVYNPGYHQQYDPTATTYNAAAYGGYHQANQQSQQQQSGAGQESEEGYYHWNVLWPKLLERGWAKLRANGLQKQELQVEYIFVLPSRDPRHGTHGVDYFGSEDEVVDYVRSEHAKQRAENEAGAVAATEAANALAAEDEHHPV